MNVDPFMLVSMGFTLVLVLLIGSFVVAFPLTRRLGAFLDEWIKSRREARLEGEQGSGVRSELQDLGARLETLERQIRLLSERQSFTESLLEEAAPGDEDAA